MSTPTSVLWDAEPHTIAKHRILRRYLDAWLPILANQTKKLGKKQTLTYIDGFAGPGIYKKGQEGSPVIAYRAALHRPQKLETDVRLVFIEQDAKRCEVLRQELRKVDTNTINRDVVHCRDPIHGECTVELDRLLGEAAQQGRPFGPAFVFLDQFGYSGIPVSLVKRILAHPQCEVFSYFNWNQLGRFLDDPPKQAALSRAFEDESWRPVLEINGEQKQSAFLRQTYRKTLEDKGKAKYVLSFAMYGSDRTLLSWLFFCTNSIDGVEHMKRAMMVPDPSGSFSFCDADDPSQMPLASEDDDSWLSKHLPQRLDRKTLTIGQLREYVLLHTPCVAFRTALYQIQKEEKLVCDRPEGRQQNDFSDKAWQVTFFANGKPGTTSSLFR